MPAPDRSDVVRHVADEYQLSSRANDERACAYFTRLVAVKLNPGKDPNGWGLLSKNNGNPTGPEHHIDGFAVDAIIYGATDQVVDIIARSGAANPGPAWQEVPKRTTNHWAAPTLPGATPAPSPPQPGQPPPRPPAEAQRITFAEIRDFEGRLEITYRDYGRHHEQTLTLPGGALLACHIDQEGWDEWHRRYESWRYTDGDSHERAVRRMEYEVDGIEIAAGLRPEGAVARWVSEFTQAPGPTPGTGAAPLRALEGRVETHGHGFKDAKGPIIPLGLHLGWLLGMLLHGEEPRAKTIVGKARQAGYQFWRVFCTLGYYGGAAWGGAEVGPNDFRNEAGEHVQGQGEGYFDQFIGMLRLAKEYDSRIDCAFGDLQRFDDVPAFFAQLGRKVRDSGLAQYIFSIQINEPYQNMRDFTPARARAALMEFVSRNPGVLWGIGAPGGETDAEFRDYRQGSPVGFAHSLRRGTSEVLEATFGHALRDEHRYPYAPMVESEPKGFGTSVQSWTREQWNWAVLHACAAIMTKQPFVFMTNAGIWPKGRDGWPHNPQDYPGFLEIPQLLARLPESIRNGEQPAENISRSSSRLTDAPHVWTDQAVVGLLLTSKTRVTALSNWTIVRPGQEDISGTGGAVPAVAEPALFLATR